MTTSNQVKTVMSQSSAVKLARQNVKCVITQFNDDVITVLVLAALHF